MKEIVGYFVYLIIMVIFRRPMNFKLLLILMTLTSSAIQGQDFSKKFSREDFPSDQFQISEKGIFFHELGLVFKVVKDIRKGNGKGEECHIYLTVYKNEFVLDQGGITDTWLEGDC